MKWRLFEALAQARAEKRPVALLTALASGQQTLLFEDDGGAGTFEAPIADAAREALRAGESRSMESDTEGKVFIHVFNPPLRMFIVGAVHITQALVPMAVMLGYAVTVVDPRRAFASPARLGDVRVLDAWPDEALAAEGLDARSAVVTLTHDPKLDDPALHAALRSKAFYIGCLGSRRTHAKRQERLKEAGFTDSDLERLHAPVGLDIGARSPAEIATAILAEMTRTLRLGTGR